MRAISQTVLLVGLVMGLAACQTLPPSGPCSQDQIAWIEENVGSDDGQGHGPDVAGEEWYYVIEARLDIETGKDFPAHATRAWCDAIRARAVQSGYRRPY